MNNIKKVIAIILCLVMAVGNFSSAFADVSKTNDVEGHWAQATIQKWMDESRISGYPDGTFKPDANITRAEFVKLVNGIIDYDAKGNIAFSDVKVGDWFYDVISIAHEIGYISGYSEKQFGPNDNITREQAATILSRIQYLQKNTSGLDNFVDKDKISSWAIDSVGAASEAGFINGYDNGSFKPLNNLSRAEAVTMLDNVLVNGKNKIITKAGTELSDKVVEGDLIIAKTVGEGDVKLNNVEVKGSLYVYGGGMNSLYFNGVKVAKIEVEKGKVRLVFDKESKVQDIIINSEAKLENDGGKIANVTINSKGKITLQGNFSNVTLTAASNFVMKDVVIENLKVDAKVAISGTGTIGTLNANADGITYDSAVKVTKTVVGENVTEKPAITTPPSSGGGSSSGGDTPVTKTYGISVTAEALDGQLSSNVAFTTDAYISSDKISDFLVNQTNSILTLGTKNARIESYLDKLIPRLQKLEIGMTPVYTEIGFDKAISYLEGTSVYSGLNGMKTQLLDGDIELKDIKDVLALYSASTVAADSGKIKSNIESYPYDTQTVSYDGNVVNTPYTVTYGTTVLDTNEEIASFILENISFSTKTVDDFFAEFGNKVIITTVVGSKTATITIEKVELK